MVLELLPRQTGYRSLCPDRFLFYGGITTASCLLLAITAMALMDPGSVIGWQVYHSLGLVKFQEAPSLYWSIPDPGCRTAGFCLHTAYQDLQAMAGVSVAIGEIPEWVVYSQPHGTFTRPVPRPPSPAIADPINCARARRLASILRRGVFLPIMAMGTATTASTS